MAVVSEPPLPRRMSPNGGHFGRRTLRRQEAMNKERFYAILAGEQKTKAIRHSRALPKCPVRGRPCRVVLRQTGGS